MTAQNSTLSQLLDHTKRMQQKAICTYSQFPVGATLQTIDGTMIGGFNIESVSYGLTMCAERVALFSALAQGHTTFTHLVLVTNSGVFPCGACRQMIYEFCQQAQITVATPTTIIATTNAQELMPHAFCTINLASSKDDEERIKS